MIPLVIAFVGLLLLGLSAGFFLAVSIGIRRQDRRRGYRSLREEDDGSVLSRTGSLVVGLRFSNDTRPSGRDHAPDPDRTPSAV
ncbi:hypothetical protein KIK06_27760 [Nocardiopsis sp. EMB25]|uniref:hypothetical protein n=1 Tax=Nocardiopsis TaxID=2013 RepID=UPI00034BC3C9|nr:MULTISPECIES: hypothetical protein [Nocardiopsis]MCY9787679.1 hypothetical protein [Nocardiopsis sp. EMB25]